MCRAHLLINAFAVVGVGTVAVAAVVVAAAFVGGGIVGSVVDVVVHWPQ